jgi:hypothetical protein
LTALPWLLLSALSRLLLAALSRLLALLARLLLSAAALLSALAALLAALVLLAGLLIRVLVHNCSCVSSLATTKPRSLSFLRTLVRKRTLRPSKPRVGSLELIAVVRYCRAGRLVLADAKPREFITLLGGAATAWPEGQSAGLLPIVRSALQVRPR